MSQQNVNTPARESKESSFLRTQSDYSGAGELLGDNFFAPVEADLVDSLLGRYQYTRAKIGEIASTVTSAENSAAVAHFISGNLSGRRGGYGISVRDVFDAAGAVASLNAAYWQEALNLTDVYEYMPKGTHFRIVIRRVDGQLGISNRLVAMGIIAIWRRMESRNNPSRRVITTTIEQPPADLA